jgi:hypothetical protein
MMIKPVRLELNNNGSWKMLGRFDASDDEHTSLVLDAAEDLVMTLNNGEPRCPTLRVSSDDALGAVLMRWEFVRGWYDARTGAPA